MVDKNVVLRKISELETYQKQIEEVSDIPIQEYKSDWKLQHRGRIKGEGPLFIFLLSERFI
ncbi:hypothetical protein [Candidatus Hakubella thermalkaliphila]|uniref:hypothetical protein n=1 Tax=Candidatus Hakubella thermalkaliphila TaxID=2754717 RepID=UPI001594DC18|nr:hypothetical protein [Candidatus Hakubella thermalkaliphila]